MSNRMLTLVWDRSQAEGSDLLVLLSLADQSNDDGESWPSVGSIAQRARLKSIRGTQKCIQRLIRLGELEVIERRIEQTRNKSNVYLIQEDVLLGNPAPTRPKRGPRKGGVGEQVDGEEGEQQDTQVGEQVSSLENPQEITLSNEPSSPSGSFEEEEKPKAPGKEDGQIPTTALSLPGIPHFDPHARTNARPVLQDQRQDVNDFTPDSSVRFAQIADSLPEDFVGEQGIPGDPALRLSTVFRAMDQYEEENFSSTKAPEIAPLDPAPTPEPAEPSRPQPAPLRAIPAEPAPETIKPNQSVIEAMAAKRTTKLREIRKRYAIGANIEDATLREIHALVPGHYGFMLQLVHDTAMPKDKLLKWLKEKPHLVKAVGGLNQERYAEILKGARHQAGQHSTGWQQYAYVWFFELLSKANLSAIHSTSTTGTVSSTKVPGLRDPLPEYMTRRNDTVAKMEYHERLSSVQSLEDLKELIAGYFDRGEISFMTGRTFARELEQRLKYNWDWKESE